jgi:hypothetical protein
LRSLGRGYNKTKKEGKKWYKMVKIEIFRKFFLKFVKKWYKFENFVKNGKKM